MVGILILGANFGWDLGWFQRGPWGRGYSKGPGFKLGVVSPGLGLARGREGSQELFKVRGIGGGFPGLPIRRGLRGLLFSIPSPVCFPFCGAPFFGEVPSGSRGGHFGAFRGGGFSNFLALGPPKGGGGWGKKPGLCSPGGGGVGNRGGGVRPTRSSGEFSQGWFPPRGVGGGVA